MLGDDVAVVNAHPDSDRDGRRTRLRHLGGSADARSVGGEQVAGVLVVIEGEQVVVLPGTLNHPRWTWREAVERVKELNNPVGGSVEGDLEWAVHAAQGGTSASSPKPCGSVSSS